MFAPSLLPAGPVCVDIAGTTLTDHEIERLQHPLTGMVILFTRNYTDREQLKALTASIHAVRPAILIAVDHEGGRVQRFRSQFTEVPAMATLAQDEQAEMRFREAGWVLASELRDCGVDLTFAPVLDIDYGRSQVIGTRSFGSTPERVTRHAQAFIDGLTEAGMTNCGKHFPGHGWAQADSHVAKPYDERSLEAVRADMLPYQALHGLHSVMTAHVAYAAFDNELATFSSALLKGELRERLGFDGLIFSDDLTMKAAATDSIVDRAERALAAGCDMVLVCNAPEQADELLAGLHWERSPQFERRFARLKPQPRRVSSTLLAQAQQCMKTFSPNQLA